MNYCPECGSDALVTRVPEGDTHAREVCESCGYVHYVNPKVIVGCIPTWGERVLLCKRAIEPRRGWWTLPAGFLEMGETMAEGAQREALEEANAVVETGALFAIYSVPHISQVYALFQAELQNDQVSAGEESLEVGLYLESEIPWDEIAFPAMHRTLELFFENRREGRYRTHGGDIVRRIGDEPETIFRIISS